MKILVLVLGTLSEFGSVYTVLGELPKPVIQAGVALSVHQCLSSKIIAGVKIAITQALERHRKLGESIVVWQDGKMVILTADQIPPLQLDVRSDKSIKPPS